MPNDNTYLIVPFDSAIAGDLAGVTAIYDDHVRHGTGSFEITLRTKQRCGQDLPRWRRPVIRFCW